MFDYVTGGAAGWQVGVGYSGLKQKDHAEDMPVQQWSTDTDSPAFRKREYTGSYAVTDGPTVDQANLLRNINARLLDTIGRLHTAETKLGFATAAEQSAVIEVWKLRNEANRIPRWIRWLFR